MKRRAYLMRLKPGCAAEYRRRHEELWPEMAETLKAAGIADYSIWLDEATGTLFAVQKFEDEARLAGLATHPVVRRWWDYMADIMETHPDHAPVEDPLVEVFRLD
ncbi:MAG TPA: L-rhamnose mutarotase [Candidatus Hydrogenedentes bacterium]|nr:L-rhamnose mutarotase [Candidatus Hydrogenedentota bacterium]HOJ69167.1 L-rhamnose mutarotase [Candidatus Hydrogenedentota bacterium]HOK90349.1 L-rhamnose mutarotase [Candidatus Hydrogenedentota bacterium]HOV61123.1 L-rhamnose mutarotase [Candidatus Hydrogenedentota bacterium]